jgi:hypothetical protein
MPQGPKAEKCAASKHHAIVWRLRQSGRGRRRGDRRRCTLAAIGRAIGSSNGRRRPRRAWVGDGGAVRGKLTELFETTLGIHRRPFWACRYSYKRAAVKQTSYCFCFHCMNF